MKNLQLVRKKRKKKDGSGSGRPKHCPLSERQQVALLMQLTAEEHNERGSPPPPSSRKTPGSSGRKDKVNKRNERGETPLHLATIRGDLPAIIDLIKQGADINVQDYAGWTPLHEACNHGHSSIAEYLLESGANVNSKGFENDYPLHDAVSNNHHKLVQLLLKHGANPLLPNKHGERPIDLSESDDITKMMQQEIISSDESESEKPHKTEIHATQEKAKWRGRSASESDHSTKPTKPPTASRQLFKNEAKAKQRSKTISSSFESDDSDDIPLSRQCSKPFSSSSGSNTDAFNSKARGSIFESVKKPRKRIKKKKSFLPSSPAASDISSSDSEKIPKKFPSSIKASNRHLSGSSDDMPSQSYTNKQKPEPAIFDPPRNALNTPSNSSHTNTEIPAKFNQADVYDLTDDFSNENDMISLKPEQRVFPKWESPVKACSIKTPTLFSRKPTVVSTATVSEKKVRKSSKDSESMLPKSEKASENKTALIRPVITTSEMLFDQLFKSPPKEHEATTQSGKAKDFENKEKVQSSFVASKTPGSLTTFSAPTTTTVVTTVSSSVMLTKTSTSATFATATATVSSVAVQVSNPDKVKPKAATNSNSGSEENDTKKRKRKSTDSEPLKPEEKPSTLAKKEPQTSTIRSVSLDSVANKIAKVDVDKLKTPDKPLENKALKKAANAEAKEKPLFSEPGKTPKAVTKSHSTESKKSTLKPVVKKESKPEPKKVALLSDSASHFMNEIDSISRQRELKLKQKKKLLQKKAKPSPVSKADEKKTPKHPQISLSDVPFMSGVTTPERLKQKKPVVPKVTKKEPTEGDQTEVSLAQVPLHPENLEPGNQKPNLNPFYPPPGQPMLQPFPHPLPSFPVVTHLPTMDIIAPPITVQKPLGFIPPVDMLGIASSVLNPPQITHVPTFTTAPTTTQCDTHVNLTPNSVGSETQPAPVAISVVTTEPKLVTVTTEAVTETASAPSVENQDSIAEPSIVNPQVAPEETEEKEQNDKEKVTKDDELSEAQKMRQEYIQQRLLMAPVCFESNEPKPLPVYIPMSTLENCTKKPANNKLNTYEERLFIQKQAYEKRRRLANVIPQAPQYYWEYMTFTGGYLLNGRKESLLSVPVLGPPPNLCDSMVELFNVHEEQRVRLRVQHAIEREKLIISCEQEIMREHCRAARTIQNQQMPYSACAVLMENEVYNLPRNPNDSDPPGKPSIRDRFNARLFISWLQDVDDKYEKMKSSLLTRQKHEAQAMYAMQKTEWCLKLQELDPSQKVLSISDVNELHVPMVNIAGDFDLLPA